MFCLSRLRMVLVQTQHSGNLGAVARAMKTMGIHDLALVAPQCHRDTIAHQRASGADDLLTAAGVYGQLAEAIVDCTLVMGCTARSRRVQLPDVSPEDAAQMAIAHALAGGQVACLFGCERSGLANDQLQQCQIAIHIPSEPTFSSLNLAAAVQVMAYLMRSAARRGCPESCAKIVQSPKVCLAPQGQLDDLYTHCAQLLADVQYYQKRPTQAAMLQLRRLIAKANLSEREVRFLRGIISQMQWLIAVKPQS